MYAITHDRMLLDRQTAKDQRDGLISRGFRQIRRHRNVKRDRVMAKASCLFCE